MQKSAEGHPVRRWAPTHGIANLNVALKASGTDSMAGTKAPNARLYATWFQACAIPSLSYFTCPPHAPQPSMLPGSRSDLLCINDNIRVLRR